MNHLFSPWRAQHIERMGAASLDGATHDEGAVADGRSVFTRLYEAGRDEENLILWRGPLTFVIMNLYPYNNGHLMIVPYREVSDYDTLTAAERTEVAELTACCMRWLRAALAPEGFNVGINQGQAAGAGIPQHLHVHVVPRWSGDTNFMPTIAQTKVIPEALQATYRKLRAAIEADPTAEAPPL